MKNRLKVISNGLTYENPFVLASGPPTASSEQIIKAFKLGWGGAVTKTIKVADVKSSNVTPRFAALKNRSYVYGFENIEMVSEKNADYWIDEIDRIKDLYPAKVLIASVMGTRGVDTWVEITELMNKTSADAVELNFSCPNGVTSQGLGMAIGQDNEVIEMLTKAVKSVSKIPVIVKLTPNVSSISSAANAALKGGADGICAINTVLSIAGVDLDTLTPYPNVAGKSTYGGLSGYCVKPIGLRCVAEVSSVMENNNCKKASMHACGGVADWKDAAEYITLGADVTQVCTEVMLKGMQIIDKLKYGLENYLESKNFNSVEELRGAAINRLTLHSNLDRNHTVKAEIDYQKCNNCGSCIIACADSAYNAISNLNNKTVIDNTLCKGCSLCSFVCPSNAITMSVLN